jgi:hypothetical protein
MEEIFDMKTEINLRFIHRVLLRMLPLIVYLFSSSLFYNIVPDV